MAKAEDMKVEIKHEGAFAQGFKFSFGFWLGTGTMALGVYVVLFLAILGA